MSVVGIPVVDTISHRANVALRWYDADESNYAALVAPSAISADVTYKWPTAGPAVSGYVLSADTAGQLSWVAQSGGGSGEVNTASNVGSGVGVWKDKSGIDLRFKSLLESLDEASQRTTIITGNTNDITIRPVGLVPVGSILAWLKDSPGVASTLPWGFAECNGQLISDFESSMNGATIPNLNNYPADGTHASGANRFLRGATGSGGPGGTASHAHSVNTTSICEGTGSPAKVVGYTPTDTQSHLPPYYNVVWIIRYK